MWLKREYQCHSNHEHASARLVEMVQELEQLNLALNNITRVQNLQRCESLRRLDLTANFVDLPGLLSLRRQAGQPGQRTRQEC